MNAYVTERLKGAVPSEAYRLVYGKLRTVSKGEADRRCWELEKDPRIRRVIDKHVGEAQAEASFGVRELFKRWVDQLNADPNELIVHRRVCCRYCYGVDYRYQWREQEYADAVTAALKLKMEPPPCDGGFGFNGTLEPMPNCPQCDGEGTGQVRIADTRKLSPAGRMLIKKIKQDKDGAVELELHDPKRTEEMIAKTLGMFREQVDVSVLMGVVRGEVNDEERAVLEAALRQRFGGANEA